MNGHRDECTEHSEVQHAIIRLAEEAMAAAVSIVMPMNKAGHLDAAESAISTARMIFCTGLETGIRIGLMDPIGAQIIIDHLDETGTEDVGAKIVDSANEVLAVDARQLLEAAARL